MKISKNKIIGRLLFTLMLVSLPLTGFSQKPDFSGKWKLNKSESTLGAEFSFAPILMTIAQKGNNFSSESVSDFQGEQMTQKNSYTLDSKESKNEGFQGSETISIVKWEADGKTLKIVSSMEMMDGGELKITGTYKLIDENLVIVNAMEGGPMESAPETWVFVRQ